MTERSKALTAAIYERDPAFAMDLTAHITLRGLFDPHCAEWDKSTVEQKVTALRRLDALGFSMAVVMEAVEGMIAIDYGHGISEADRAVKDGCVILLRALIPPAPTAPPPSEWHVTDGEWTGKTTGSKD